MTHEKLLSASPTAVFSLFDPTEQQDFLIANDVRQDELADRFTASDLLNWIVQNRSAFLKMAVEIANLLTKIEASLKGNVEFIVATQDGQDLDLAFGPQIRRLLLTAASWINQARPDIAGHLASLKRAVTKLSTEARPTHVKRDSSIGRTMRDYGQQGSPFDQMLWDRRADMMQLTSLEVHSADIEIMREVRDRLSTLQQKVDGVLADNLSADTIGQSLTQISGIVEDGLQKIEGKVSQGYGGPPPLLDKGDYHRVSRAISEIESLVRQATRMDETGAAVFEAMKLALWKERWRIYELWVFCSVCMVLARQSEIIDTMGRVRDGRWTLKFTRDASPAMAFLINERWFDVFYQYFEKGGNRANMPDIALRERTTGRWLAIIDPKMGESFTQRDHEEVCLRYAKAFEADASIIASYFPDQAGVEILAYHRPALICNGLRPATATSLHRALADAVKGVGLCLPTKNVVVLADVSGSTSTKHSMIASAIHQALRADAQVDPHSSTVASFSDGLIQRKSVADFLEMPSLPDAGGGTDHRAAFSEATASLSMLVGDKEIWLFGDGDGASFDPKAMMEQNICVSVYLCGTISQTLRNACLATGGKAVEIT